MSNTKQLMKEKKEYFDHLYELIYMLEQKIRREWGYDNKEDKEI